MKQNQSLQQLSTFLQCFVSSSQDFGGTQLGLFLDCICHVQSQRDAAESYSSGILYLDLKHNFVWTQPTLQKHEISHISAGKTGFWPQGSSCMSAVVLLRSEGLPLVEVELVHSFQWVPLQKPDRASLFQLDGANPAGMRHPDSSRGCKNCFPFCYAYCVLTVN